LIAIRYGCPAPRLESKPSSFSAAAKSRWEGSPGIVSAVASLGASDIFHAFGAPRLVSHLRCGRSAELKTSVPGVVPVDHWYVSGTDPTPLTATGKRWVTASRNSVFFES
jgi:hypothetical protein